MNDALANLVYPVLSYGLALKERLLRGQNSSLAAEQAALRALLLEGDLETRLQPDFSGEDEPGLDEKQWVGGERFLGVRYALTCWLDETLTRDSPWEPEWNEHKLEVQIYGGTDRDWRFWQQAQLAEDRPTSDALEVFYLCVMLGFRGELGEATDQLRSWSSAAVRRLSQRGDWHAPPGLEPPTQVPPLRGAERLRRTICLATLVAVLLLPLTALLIVLRLAE